MKKIQQPDLHLVLLLTLLSRPQVKTIKVGRYCELCSINETSGSVAMVSLSCRGSGLPRGYLAGGWGRGKWEKSQTHSPSVKLRPSVRSG